VNIAFISVFLSPYSKGGPALRAKNSLAILQQLGNVKSFDLETISRFSWSGGETRSASEIRQGARTFIESSYRGLYKLLSRSLQIIEILTQIISVSAYFRLSKFIKESSPDVVWFSYASDYPRLFLLLRRSFPLVPFVADTQAVVSTHLQRAADEMSGIRRIVYKHIAREKKRHETLMIGQSTVTTAVSEIDLVEYSSRAPSTNLALFPNVIEASALDQDSHLKSNTPTVLITGTFGGKEGAMTHGTVWFLREVFPKVRESVANVAVNIVGRNANRVLEFVELPNQVKIQSDVASLAPFFSEAWCSICPIFFESGTRFKILEASERAVPTVSTTLGAEGLDFLNKEEILIGDEPREFAELVISLLSDQDLGISIGERAREKVIRKYSTEAGTMAARKILDRCLLPS
jgi:glycosyltransferase involved in cell wall biosynthesis